MQPDIPPEAVKAAPSVLDALRATLLPEALRGLPGALGAIVALRWITGTPMQRMASFIGGVAASRYGADHAAAWMGTSAGLTGFLIGLFGMAVAAKVFEAIAAFDLGGTLSRLLRKWGL